MPLTPKPQHLLISRTDAIGDVVLTLPLAAYLKTLLPGCRVSFLGRNYTGPVIKTCTEVDEFISYDDITVLTHQEQIAVIKSKKFDAIVHVFPDKGIAWLAKKAGIHLRIGTTNRFYHWYTCNKLVKLSRKNSNLHEAQLNLALLKPFGYKGGASLPDVVQHYKFKDANNLPDKFKAYLPAGKFNLIIHPKSNGSGMEWGLDNFAELIDFLPADKFNIIISGSDKETALLSPWIATLPKHVIDMTGQMSLPEFISFIFNAGGLIASGTGPLHIAAASGIHTLGLFPSLRPIHAGRWAPLGKQAGFLESGTETIDAITIDNVLNKVIGWIK